MTTTFILLLLPFLPQAEPPTAKPFESIAFLVGTFEGSGKSQMGAYSESLSGRFEVAGTVLTVRSSSKAAGRTVFGDLRVFSHDRFTKRLRCRQFAFGAVATYDIEVDEEGKKVVMTEASYEGGKRAPWRYTFSDISESGFSYVVQTRNDGGWRPYVSGKLERKGR